MGIQSKMYVGMYACSITISFICNCMYFICTVWTLKRLSSLAN